MSYLISADNRKYTLQETDTVASILQNVAIILSTPKGSVPMYREFGVSIDVLDRPVPAAKALLVSRVKEAVEQFEPRARVLRVSFAQDEADPGHLIPTVEIDIVEDGQ